jgi:hypothetical protein
VLEVVILSLIGSSTPAHIPSLPKRDRTVRDRTVRDRTRFRVSVRVMIDRRIDHPTDHPMGRYPHALAHLLRALHPRSGVPIGCALRKLQISSDFKVKGARTSRDRTVRDRKRSHRKRP